MTMAYVPLVAGRFGAHRVRVDGHWLTLVEGPRGAVYGSIAGRHLPGSTRRRPKIDGMIFSALTGAWFLPSLQAYQAPGPYVPGLPQSGRDILDSAGGVCARFERPTSKTRLIHLPGETFTWQRHAMPPAYRIDDVYTASRTTLHQLLAGFSNRPFTGTVGPRLADRPDGTLGLLIAAWLTNNAIEQKVRDAQSAAVGQPN